MTLAYYTTILASSGGVVDAPLGGCCTIRGDTLLQINYLGRLTLGVRTLQLANVRIETRLTDAIWHTGDDDVLLMIREDGYRMRFYFPVRPTLLEVLALEEPSATSVGHVRGRLSFEAAGILQTFDTRGNATYTPIGDRTTKVYAEFDTPLSFKLFTPPVISPP